MPSADASDAAYEIKEAPSRVADRPDGAEERLDSQEVCCLFSDGTLRLDDGAGVSFHADGATIHMADRGANDAALLDLSALAMERAADAANAMLVHAACLRVGEAWVMLLAESGTGKATSSLAMAKAAGGAGFGGDDAALLHWTQAGPEAVPLPRDLHIALNSDRLLGWTADLAGPVVGDVERRVPLAELGDLVSPVGSRPIAALLLLTRAEAPSVAAASQTEALLALSADHVRRSAGALPPDQARRFDHLAQLSQACPAFQIALGPDPSQGAHIVWDLLATELNPGS